MSDLRKAFTEELLALARSDKRIYALATDSRGSVTLTNFARELPGQFVECGIAEQNAVGIAAGMTSFGVIPFVCSPASFLSARAAEQIKVDIAYSHKNVKLVGVSGGISYGALGATHHTVHDIAWMRTLPGLQVWLPSDGRQTRAMTRVLALLPEPVYVRMGRGDTPDIYDQDPCFTPGKANLLRLGSRAAILACGEMVWPALRAAELLGDALVYDMPCIKPLDEEAILRAAETGLVVTAEEHSVKGGLGSAVAEVLSQRRPVRMRMLGLPDETLYNGDAASVKAHYGLTPEGIAEAVRSCM